MVFGSICQQRWTEVFLASAENHLMWPPKEKVSFVKLITPKLQTDTESFTPLTTNKYLVRVFFTIVFFKILELPCLSSSGQSASPTTSRSLSSPRTTTTTTTATTQLLDKLITVVHYTKNKHTIYLS